MSLHISLKRVVKTMTRMVKNGKYRTVEIVKYLNFSKNVGIREYAAELGRSSYIKIHRSRRKAKFTDQSICRVVFRYSECVEKCQV